jgi:crAss001_48 related protein
VTEFQQRVIDEKRDLDEKLRALDAFTRTEDWNSLEPEDVRLLARQAECMAQYSATLAQRIARFRR